MEDNEELLDEFFQLGEDFDPDVISEFGELGDNRFSSRWPFWVKRYTVGEICVHLHYGIRSRDGESKLADGCAVYKRAASGVHSRMNVKVNVFHGVYSEDLTLQNRASDMGLPMPVPDSHVVDNPEGVSFGVVDSTVRLQPLDDCLGTLGHSSHLVRPLPLTGSPLRVPFLAMAKNRGRSVKMGNSVP